MKVSVLLVTYNHENYIRQSVQSVLDQRGVADIEILVSDDCSTDRTPQILSEIQTQFAGRLRVLNTGKNIGSTRNYFDALPKCSGEYIALLDGDDFWTSPEKIVRQAEYLDTNQDCAICFHNANVIYEDGEHEPHEYVKNRQPEKRGLPDLLLSNFMPTCSVMFRNRLFGETPTWVYDLKMGDYPLHVLNAQFGQIGYIDEIMATYRVNSGGIWAKSGFEQQVIADLELYEALSGYLDDGHHEVLQMTTHKRWSGLASFFREMAKDYLDIHEARRAIAEEIIQIEQRVPVPRRWKSRLMSTIFLDRSYGSYLQHNYLLFWYAWMRAILHDPRWLVDRGSISRALRTIAPYKEPL
jgi:glycosyltransferase involved in cell wall biosynthesis